MSGNYTGKWQKKAGDIFLTPARTFMSIRQNASLARFAGYCVIVTVQTGYLLARPGRTRSIGCPSDVEI